MQDTPKEAATGDKAARDLMLSELLQACTPAPWKAVTNSWDISSIYDESKQCIAKCQIGYFLGDALEEHFEAAKDANAKLIALAPTIAAELIKERAVNAKLQAEIYRLKFAHIALGEVISNHCIAMQSAIIEAEINGAESGMEWIANTLIGPGLFPDIDDAKSIGGAQAWFDRETAKELARVTAIKQAEEL
jgi:hypothetical protein